AQRQGSGQRCYAIVGDGESNEGAVWEALLFANQFRLANLLIIVDANGFQAMGATEEVMRLGSLADKLSAFGLEVREVDGHDEAPLDEPITKLNASAAPGPKALVARTIKGKGVSFMENDNRWHYTRLDERTYTAAMAELQAEASHCLRGKEQANA